jgi:hypothetical protein
LNEESRVNDLLTARAVLLPAMLAALALISLIAVRRERQ